MRDFKKRPSLPLINDRIKADKLQVISSDGRNLGEISRADALREAELAGLDLVVISESRDSAPVAKIMDFGKSLYDKKKKMTESKKKQTQIKVKEVKLRPKIGEHDYMTKMKRGIQFLSEGKRLKVTLMFRGRENAHKADLGPQLFARVTSTLSEHFGATTVASEGESRAGSFWSRVYYIKS